MSKQIKIDKYLDINPNNTYDEVRLVIRAANHRYYATNKICSSKHLSINIKSKQHISYVQPIMTYCYKTQLITK